MKAVRVEFNDKNWCDPETGEERPATQKEVAGVFETFSKATETTYFMVRQTEVSGFWYCDYNVDDYRVQAFITIFDWTMDFRAYEIPYYVYGI